MSIHYELQNNRVTVPVTLTGEGFTYEVCGCICTDTHLKSVSTNGVFKGIFEYTLSLRGKEYGVKTNLVDNTLISITLEEYHKIIFKSDTTKPRVFSKQ